MSNADIASSEKPTPVQAATMLHGPSSYQRVPYPANAYGTSNGQGKYANQYGASQLADAFAGLSTTGQIQGGGMTSGPGAKPGQNNMDLNNLSRGAAYGYGYTPGHFMLMSGGSTLPLNVYGNNNGGSTSPADQSGQMQYLPTGMFPNFVSNSNPVNAPVPAYGWPYGVQNEVQGLDMNRRNSWSSHDENGAATPAAPINGHHDYYAGISGLDRPSMVNFPYATPTPSVIQPYVAGPMQPMKCADNKNYESVNLDILTQQLPSIPRAVPALWTNQEDLSLAKCLQNPEGITNIYIRGFLPDVTDQDIHDYAGRFGEIESCKAIVDMDTGKCKGFGFVKYFSPASAENCIRGFFHLGYQASYAQKSRNSRLKDLEDRLSANIYCTGVPIKWNEADLASHFEPFHAVSTKICREPDTGICKEVGFARFENRDIAEQVIRDFHNMSNEVDGVKLCLRFADTKAQKQLKQTSQEKRNWRAHEYKYSVEHTPSPNGPRMHQLGSQVSSASHMSYQSPAGGSTTFTPATSVSPPELAGINRAGNNKGGAWPIQGGLPPITIAPAYHPPHRTQPSRVAHVDHLPVKTNMQVMQAAGTPTKSKTPSPQKAVSKGENVSPTRVTKESSSAMTPGTV